MQNGRRVCYNGFMSVLIETITPPELGRFDVALRFSAEICITPEKARRLVSKYVSHHIADLLHGEPPHLVWRDQGAFWRVPIALSSPKKGRIGSVGTIDVDVQSGKTIIPTGLKEQIEKKAENLAHSATL